MRFPNAHEGVKKIFTAEILMIIVTIGTVIVSGISMSGDRSEGAANIANRHCRFSPTLFTFLAQLK